MGHLRVDSSQLRRRPRGLSLMELLLTMFLFSAVLAMVASLARNYSEADRVLQGKTRGQLTQLMLMGLATEVGGSQVIRPQLGDGLVGEVELRRYAASGQRLASGTGRAGWTPDQVLTLRYLLDGETLVRQADYPDGTTRRQSLGDGVAGFSASRLDQRTLQLRASFRESNLIRTVSVAVYLWTQ